MIETVSGMALTGLVAVTTSLVVAATSLVTTVMISSSIGTLMIFQALTLYSRVAGFGGLAGVGG